MKYFIGFILSLLLACGAGSKATQSDTPQKAGYGIFPGSTGE